MHRIFITIAFGLILQLTTAVAFAADCTIIYGGGQIDCTKQEATTPSQSPAPTSKTAANQTQTKGGLPVHKQTTATKTPATGPEAIGLITLIPMAAAGFYLRKKTKI